MTLRARVLVAGVGNVLRGDDGFGPAVAARLAAMPPGQLPDGARVVETGIGGVALLQELMDGFDGLVLVDAVDRGAKPGTIFRIEPEVGEAVHVPDVHLANPERVLTMARSLGVLPGRLAIVGCQAADVDELSERLSPAVERAVERAAAEVVGLLRAWLAAPESADERPAGSGVHA